MIWGGFLVEEPNGNSACSRPGFWREGVPWPGPAIVRVPVTSM